MKYDLAIVTTTCFTPYGHVKDREYRMQLLIRMHSSLGSVVEPRFKYAHLVREDTNWNENYLELLAQARRIAPLCLVADSDGYFDPDWQMWLHEAMYWAPDAAGWSLYNSPRLKQYDVRDWPDDNFERSHVGPHGLCFRTEDYVAPPKGEWFETFIGELPKKHSMGFFLPKVSLLQHCGMYGLNNLPGASEDFDPNFPYNRECGIQDFIDAQQNQSQNPIEGENLCKTT